MKAVAFRFMVLGIIALIVLVIVLVFVYKTSGYTLPKITLFANNTAQQSNQTMIEQKKSYCESLLVMKSCDTYNNSGCKNILGKECIP